MKAKQKFFTPEARIRHLLNITFSLLLYATILAGSIFVGYQTWRFFTLNSLYRQMQTANEQKEWQVVRSLAGRINDLHSNYRDTQAIYLESLYQEILQSIQNSNFDTAQETAKNLYLLDPAYKDISTLQCNAWYLPANEQVTANEFVQARDGIKGFLESHSYCEQAIKLYLESYQEQASYMINTGEFQELVSLSAEYKALTAPFRSQSNYNTIAESIDGIIMKAYKDALKEENWDKARALAKVIGETRNNSELETSMILETYYQPAYAYKIQRNWIKAAEAYAQLYKLNPSYRDTRESLLTAYIAQSNVEKNAGSLANELKWLELAAAIDPNYDNCSERAHEIRAVTNLSAWLSSSKVKYTQLKKHSKSVRDIQFSPNGEFLLSASYDETVAIWSTKKWNLSNTLRGHSEPVFAVAISPNSRLVVTASLDHTAILWDLVNGQQTVLSNHSREVISAAFSPKNDLLATGSMDQTIILWDTIGNQTGKLKGHKGDIYSIAFSPDGKFLASTGEDRNVLIWDVASKSLIKTYKLGFTSKQLRFSHNGNYLAVLQSKAKLIHLIDMGTAKIQDIKVDFIPADVAWTIDDKYLLPVGPSVLWVGLDGKLAKNISVPAGAVSIDMAPDASTIAIGLNNGDIDIIAIEP